MKKILPIFAVVIVILVGGYMMLNKPEISNPEIIQEMPLQESSEPANEITNDTENPASESAVEKGKTYTLAEISAHKSATDCWFAVEGVVYDVTKYIEGAKHPGGKALLEGCGKDATELFNTRPMGSKTPHSDKARGFITNFKIGMLAE